MKVCSCLFKSYPPIKSIYSTSGDLIKSISDIIPGSTILVSSREPTEDPEPLKVLTPPPQLESSPLQSPKVYELLFNEKYRGPALKSGKPSTKVSPARKQSPPHLNESKIAGRQVTSPSDMGDPAIVPPKEEISKGQRSKGKVDSPTQEGPRITRVDILSRETDASGHPRTDSPTVDNRAHASDTADSPQRKKRRSRSPKSDTPEEEKPKIDIPKGECVEDGNSKLDSPTRPTVADARSFSSDSLSDTPACEALSVLFAQFVGATLEPNISPAFKGTGHRTKDLLRVAPELENQQMDAWFHSAHAYFATQVSGDTDLDMRGIPQTREFADKFLNQRRFVWAGGVDYRVQVGLVGPRHSGKSQLLALFADEVMLAYADAGLWKRTFFVFINVRLIAPYMNDMGDFYYSMVEIALQSLVWQRPFFRPWLAFLNKFFRSLPGSRGCPRISKSSRFWEEFPQFAIAFQRIADRVFDAYTDPEGLDIWLTTVFMFPSLIGAATGFSNVFYFVDNIEYADLELGVIPPFTEMNRTCFVLDFFKDIIQRGNFIVAAENQDRLHEALSRFADGGVDLSRGVEFVSTIGILDEEDNRVIKLEIEGEPVVFPLTIDHCCGIPAFVALWRELNDGFDELDSAQEDEKDELSLVVIAQAQNVVDALFEGAEESYLFVTAAKR
jgi:hypothetical protein